MNRPRYSIMPLQNEQGAWVYLFRDHDLTRSTNGGPVQYGVACHYDGPKKNWTKTLDPIEAIKICGDLNEQEEKRVMENPDKEKERLMQLAGFYGKQTKRTKGFWDILGLPRG